MIYSVALRNENSNRKWSANLNLFCNLKPRLDEQLHRMYMPHYLLMDIEKKEESAIELSPRFFHFIVKDSFIK